ncbi:hypothetical protein [Clostridium oryzae]|uniref:Uncharacterized protein n=1 Tax=Clostridium oryzae TaxID=1450648 RepID=A0A1V4I9B8_9CLOT|nr:hypothetical protein [Clostridium oryzae]OPJ56591.1 hypothetical protein CLORY_42700 [Clostridium oryzae]
MYDAKKEDKSNKKDKEMKYSTIYGRSYYNRERIESFASTKTSHIPSETMFY